MNEADVLRVIVALILILVVIMAGAWAVRRSGFARGAGRQALQVVASQTLGNRAWVAIVEVEDARLVVGVTAQQVTLLHSLPARPPGADVGNDTPDGGGSGSGSRGNDAGAAALPGGFTAAFTRALKRR